LKKEFLAGAALLVLLAAALLNTRALERISSEAARLAADSRAYAEAGDFERAEKELDSLRDMWEASGSYTRIVLNHGRIEAVADIVCELSADLRAGNAAAASGEYEKLIAALENIEQTERVTFGSVF